MKAKDPWVGIKTLAANRVQLPDLADLDDDALMAFAKHKLCKARGILFLDPVWDRYTKEELLIEYFSHLFEEDPNHLEEFLNSAKGVDQATLDWFERMDTEYQAELQANAEEFEETFDGA